MIRSVPDKQLRFAAAVALTRVAKASQAATYDTMRSVFDRPTPFALRSIKVTPATKAKLEARVALRDDTAGKGSSYADAIGHEFTGGVRKFKRSEGALRRAGLLRDGWIVVPGEAAELDAYGNITRSQIVRILAYVQAFGEQGYRANMTAKSKGRLAKRGLSGGGFKQIKGVEYFVSRGKGEWFGGGSWRQGRRQHLAPGVWSRTGTHGADIKPVLMFVRQGVYQRRIDLPGTVSRTVGAEFEAEFDEALEMAGRSAR